MTIETSRARTLAVFGSVRIGEYVVPAGAPRPPFAGPRDGVGLHIVRSGEIAIDTKRGRHVFRAGDVYVSVFEPQMTFSLTGNVRLLSLIVPSAVLEGVGAPPAGQVRHLPSNGPLLAPTVDFIRRAAEVESASLTGFATYYFERLLQEMLIGVLIGGTSRVSIPQEPGVFAHSIAIITAQLSDHSLSPRSVADEVKISLRQLQRMHSARGTTVEREIRRARVEHAMGLLRDRTYDAMSVEQIGRYSGFSGGSSLARAMAAEGKMSPARERRHARTAERVA
ncbi:helix-turn-helix domain-containing protein [Microbacterium pygmaeum]|uniref:AraC-binding-like domain-containing protein n=1 Tax=Microbacterium pygmaeum TaxID=370764 RepID=A0A1G8DY43_9MICO|nr:helix-turn-helix domain-containing protein [Microbacterium pygmaeum]SDH62508.1 AraC-binding-like domain-containing protein [Microbacterium pygmaeum]